MSKDLYLGQREGVLSVNHKLGLDLLLYSPPPCSTKLHPTNRAERHINEWFEHHGDTLFMRLAV